MCLLIFKPAGVDLAELLDDVDDITTQNSDGFGVAYHEQNTVRTKRGFYKPDDQRKIISALDNFDAIIHWRFGTSGKRNEANCHPFRLPDGSAFAHNGIIPDKRIVPSRKRSDTAVLAAAVLNADHFLAVVNEIDIGGSKFALMRPDGHTEIVNEDFGEWKGGIWYSNRNHCDFGRFGLSCAWTDDADYDFPTVDSQFKGYTPDELQFALEELVERFGYRFVCETLEDYPFAWENLR